MTSEPTTTSASTTTDGDELDRVADRLVEQARTDGVALTGPGGLLGGLTRKVLETALAAWTVTGSSSTSAPTARS